MPRFAFLLLAVLSMNQPAIAQNSYQIANLSAGFFAAIALPGGPATSNAMIVDLGTQAVVCGAHFSVRPSTI